jgi:hypothetical protein
MLKETVQYILFLQLVDTPDCRDRRTNPRIFAEIIFAGKGQHDPQNMGPFLTHSPHAELKKGLSHDNGPASTLKRHVSRPGGWRPGNEGSKTEDQDGGCLFLLKIILKNLLGVGFLGVDWLPRLKDSSGTGEPACMQVCGSGLKSASPG